MINEVNQKGESAQDSYLKTKKKGNITVNPKKEDLMSELYSSKIKSSLQDIKEKAAQAFKETKQKVKKSTPVGGDVEPQNPQEEVEVKSEIDDSEAKKEISERMRQRLLQLTQEHDSKYMIDIADPK
tara:strand:+ start:1275 stop:1655 length:381 start_codon:yes stop_codon:yes gene_type:complete